MSKFVIGLERKLVKWDRYIEVTSTDEMKPWQYRVTIYFVFIILLGLFSALATDLLQAICETVFGGYAVLMIVCMLAIPSEFMMWYIMREERLAEAAGHIAMEQDIRYTDYGKVIRIGQGVFIFRAIPRHGSKNVNQQWLHAIYS